MSDHDPGAQGARRIAFGPGWLVLGADGSVTAISHPTRPRSMLLSEDPDAPEALMHDSSRRWGKGFVIADGVGRRFDSPTSISVTDDGAELSHDLGPLDLRVRRRMMGEAWVESYLLHNVSSGPARVGSIAVSTPWRDLYRSSRESLREAVHAHVWTGGADAWAWAVPMDGSAPGLGLNLLDGELWAYSIESRDAGTGSNVRGHIYLHVTDHARAPHAMGGQPEIVLEPGQAYSWSWRLAWYQHLADFRAVAPSLLDAEDLAAPVGSSIRLQVAPGVTLNEPQPVVGTVPGVRHVDARVGDRRTRIALLFHQPLRQLVEARVRFVLDRQRAAEAPGTLRFAFVPYDNDAGLTVLAGSWRDWSDVRERVAMALLLQEALDRGWGDRGELEDAVTGYQQFVVEHVVDAAGTVSDDTRHALPPRLYNFPWFARFLLACGDLDRAVLIVDRYYALGGDDFLAFGLGPLLNDLERRLAAAGRPADASRMRDHLLRHAGAFLRYGDDLPAHEVNYEQSMVAPLLELLLTAHREQPGSVPAEELTRRLPWLTAFAADQPDARLRHVPIRHWDGYWFGRSRLWGDVFPHYWSVLSAGVYLGWPASLADEPTLRTLRRMGRSILRANLVHFASDGSASCAFVYPSCVNGEPAHMADPLANDQDWALLYALRLGLEQPIPR